MKRLLIAGVLTWSLWRVTNGEVVNARGWSTFSEFWTTVVRPDLGAEFLRLTLDAAATTLALAILGTALALVIGVFAAPVLSERVGARVPRAIVRSALTVPRAVHEIIWALLAVQVFGFDAWVGVVAIGLPFGAITAKVFAETIDEADPAPYRRLRAGGAGSTTALFYGVLPGIRGELVSFAFYRLECAIRSAAVLGVIGVGGLGFQLDLSFESLRYDQIWTLIFALMLLSGSADRVSAMIRGRSRRASTDALLSSTPRTGGLLAIGVASVVASWWWVQPDAALVLSARTRERFGVLMSDLFWPRLGPGGWSSLLAATVDTIAMSIVALALAVTLALVASLYAARPVGVDAASAGIGRWFVGSLVRLVLLLWRAVPAPIWAFLFVLVLFPGPWPGAVALGIYNAGVLARLFAEVIEERDTAASDRLRSLGAGSLVRHVYAVLPTVAGRLTSITLYRWEVIVRETVVVGVVGAGGLGQLINEHRAARDFAAVCGAVLMMVVLAAVIDAISGVVRRSVRVDSGRGGVRRSSAERIRRTGSSTQQRQRRLRAPR